MRGQVAALQQIANTPESWSYQRHMRLAVLFWCHLLPLSLLPSLGPVAIPLASIMGFLVVKLDDISIELQCPFGTDLSDIDLQTTTDQFAGVLEFRTEQYVFKYIL